MAQSQSTIDWLRERVMAATASLTAIYKERPLTVAAFAGALPAALALRALYADYTAWLALGAGGLPHNALGYLIQVCMRIAAPRDTRSLDPYLSVKQVSVYKRDAAAKYLADLPKRAGPRPTVPPFVAPQRQTDQIPGYSVDKAIRDLADEAFASIAARNPDSISVRSSRLEGRGPAWFLGNGRPLPEWASRTGGEMAHFHGGSAGADGSAHVLLGPRDAREVVEKGWGERHRLSGVGGAIPVGYTLVYAPRTGEELDVVLEILKAGVRAHTRGAVLV